ncbi:MAG: NAD(P)-dependent oxidoreductase [Patescibacteria group bacterium]
MNNKNIKIAITGGAGFVGQNLLFELKSERYTRFVVIDKSAYNLSILHRLHPEVDVVEADLAISSDFWERTLEGVDVVIQLQAQITSTHSEQFKRNTIDTTYSVLNACRKFSVPRLIHVSSSVVNSVATDDYTNAKKIQEAGVLRSGLRYTVLRPTLMFGPFDPKHLGWLSRFMEKTPIFPIPGNGKFLRQPLYVKDFCRCLVRSLKPEFNNQVFDIVGDTRIDYQDIIFAIIRAKKLSTKIIHIPIVFFGFMLQICALFVQKPPFTVQQLTALVAGDDFKGVDTKKVFGVTQTPFEDAIQETFVKTKYIDVVLRRQ